MLNANIACLDCGTRLSAPSKIKSNDESGRLSLFPYDTFRANMSFGFE